MNQDNYTLQYLTKYNLPIDGLMEGSVHFGDEQLNTICKEALAKDDEIEFFYATDEDQLADKLSYKLISRKDS